MGQKIPFNKPFIVGRELEYIAQSVASGHSSGDGEFTLKCQQLLEGVLDGCKVMLTPSGTAALEMSALLCDVGPEDEVVMPPFTFVTTANAFHLRGAKIVFADIREDTLNIDEALVNEAVSERTKAIVPVHYAGVGCEMDSIVLSAKSVGAYVVEDAAQALGSRYKDRPLGAIGDLGCISFHETKNYICGEGGALVVRNPDLVERAEIIREKGTNRSKFFRGEVDKYTWVDIGSSYLLSDILAAFLYAQLEKMDVIDKRRGEIFDYYMEGFGELQNRGMARLPIVPEGCRSNSHLFYLLLDSPDTLDGLIAHLKERDIMAVFHYQPLHLSNVGAEMGYRAGQFPVTESVSQKLLRLPFYYELSKNDQNTVISAINGFFGL